MFTTTPTTAPDIPLPVGAVSTEDWQPNRDGSYYRSFEGETREVVAGTRYGAHTVAAYANGIQHNDGRIDDGATDPVFAAPTIDLMTIDDGWDGSEEMTRYRSGSLDAPIPSVRTGAKFTYAAVCSRSTSWVVGRLLRNG